MSNAGITDQERNLLAELKQDTINAANDDSNKATKEHIAGAAGKLASAISQGQGDSDIPRGTAEIQREVEASGGKVDRDAISQKLHAAADAKINEAGGPDKIERRSEAAKMNSAAGQYDLAQKGTD